MIALYDDPGSPHCLSVRIALAEKGLDYERHPIDLAAFEQHGAAFLAVNPSGQVPVLEDDGHRLTESFFILLYLDERYPDPPLGGGDAKTRYAVQRWGKYVETHVAPNLAVVGWDDRGGAPYGEVRAGFHRLTPERRLLWQQACDGFQGVEAAGAAVAKAIARMASDLQGGPWLAGPEYGIADIAVFPHAIRAQALGFDLPAEVSGWSSRIAERPAVQEALRGRRQLVTMGPERGRWG